MTPPPEEKESCSGWVASESRSKVHYPVVRRAAASQTRRTRLVGRPALTLYKTHTHVCKPKKSRNASKNSVLASFTVAVWRSEPIAYDDIVVGVVAAALCTLRGCRGSHEHGPSTLPLQYTSLATSRLHATARVQKLPSTGGCSYAPKTSPASFRPSASLKAAQNV